jgi:hypothetical protein
MLLKRTILDGIADGRISLVFRRWRRPTVKKGSTLNTAIGVLAIDDVALIDARAIADRDSIQAGYATLTALKAELSKRTEGDIYRIAVRRVGADPRIALRADNRLSDEDFAVILARLERLDRGSPWTLRMLDVIAAHPTTRAADLAAMFGQETAALKVNVRKLKALGLTESLDRGYRLSPRGMAARAHLNG